MKVCVVMDNGFEELEAMGPIALLRRAGLDVDLIGIENDSVTGRFGVTYSPVIPMDAYDFSKADCLVLPGGPHWQKIEKNEKILETAANLCPGQDLGSYLCVADDLGKARIVKRKKIYLFQKHG